jgi:AcrR family transcriptional regulator
MTDARRMKSTVRKTARGDTLSHRQGSQAGGSVLEPRGKDTRQRIIVAVWEALAQHGYAKLTVRLVGETAGVSHAMIHYYFATKDDLLLAVVEQARGNWIHPLEDYVFGPGSSLDKLDNIIVWMAEPATREVMRVHRQLLSQSEWNEDLRQAMARASPSCFASWNETTF